MVTLVSINQSNIGVISSCYSKLKFMDLDDQDYYEDKNSFIDPTQSVFDSLNSNVSLEQKLETMDYLRF